MPAIALQLLGFPFASEQKREGPPLEQLVSKGRIGSIEYEYFREIYRRSPDLMRRRHPVAGVSYAAKPYRHALMQGQGVFRYTDPPLWLLHNFFCWQMAGTAEMPWSCESKVFLLEPGAPVTMRPAGERPWQTEEDGFAVIDEKDGAEVEGDFDWVVPHPRLPLFAAVQLGCCGSESRVSVYDLDGRSLCPPAELYFGVEFVEGSADESSGPWDKLKVEKGKLYCPDGRRATLETATLDDPADLIRTQAPAVLETHRLPDATDLAGDLKQNRWKQDKWARGYLGIPLRPSGASRPTARPDAAPDSACSASCRAGPRGRVS